jgi:hypothetical protein
VAGHRVVQGGAVLVVVNALRCAPPARTRGLRALTTPPRSSHWHLRDEHRFRPPSTLERAARCECSCAASPRNHGRLARPTPLRGAHHGEAAPWTARLSRRRDCRWIQVVARLKQGERRLRSRVCNDARAFAPTTTRSCFATARHLFDRAKLDRMSRPFRLTKQSVRAPLSFDEIREKYGASARDVADVRGFVFGAARDVKHHDFKKKSPRKLVAGKLKARPAKVKPRKPKPTTKARKQKGK